VAEMDWKIYATIVNYSEGGLCIPIMYVKVITWSGGIYLIYTHDAQGHAAPEGECVYIRQIPTDQVIIIILH